MIVVTAFVGTIAAARITRLVVADSYPPAAWIRMRWDALTHDGSWSELAHCGWCFSPYAAAVVFAPGYFLHWPTWWYVVTCWLTASYLAGWFVFHDEGRPLE